MGQTPAPKMFSSPSITGQSQQNNLVQEAQAAPQIQGPQFVPLQPDPVPPTPPQAQPDPNQQQMMQKFRGRSMPSFYGGESSY